MPNVFFDILSRLSTRAGRGSRDGRAVTGAYQRGMLYGGAALLSVAIFVAIAISVDARIDRFTDDQRYLFFNQRNHVQMGVQLAESRLQELVVQHEARHAWGIGAHPVDALLAKYAGLLAHNGGIAVAQSDLAVLPYTLVAPQPDDFRQHASYVSSLLHVVSPTLGIRGVETGNFVFDGDERIFAFYPAFEASAALARQGHERVRTLALAETAEIRKALAQQPGPIAWTKPHRSPLTGKWIVQYAASIERHHKRVAVVGYDIKLADFSGFFLEDQPLTPGFLLFSRDATAVMAGRSGGGHKTFDIVQAVARGIPVDAFEPRMVRAQGMFLLVQRIRGPGWVAVHAFDWAAIVTGLRGELSIIAFTAGAVLSLLWVFAWAFDKYVLIPTQRRERETQQRLIEAKRGAEAATHAKSMFLAVMSHEIRTPLHAALGNLELLSRHALAPAQGALVATIGKSFGMLRRLLNDILDFSKIEAGELRLESIAFDPAELAETCAQAIAPTLMAKGVRLQLLADASLPDQIQADPLRLQQVIMNLLDNAAKFTAAGRIVLEMSLAEARDDHDILRIHVIDSGIGIAANDQKHLFRPFTQASESTARFFGGTGLGLSLCKRLTELMGGGIYVASTPGVGSTFSVEVPVVAPASRPAAQAAELSIDGLTVLVCCGDADWREMLVSRIESWGIAVEIVTMASLPDKRLRERVLLHAQLGGVDDADRQAVCLALDHGLTGVVLVSDVYPLAPEPSDRCVVVSSLSRLALRRALVMAAGTRTRPGRRPVALGSSRRPRARLLIVEDDDVARALLMKQLDALGFHGVDDVADGTAAIAHCRCYRYDLILTDLNMPDMRGTELLARLRQIGVATPVVLFSASVPVIADACSASHAFAAMVEKPLSITQLAALLDRLLPTDVRGKVDGKVVESRVDPASHRRTATQATNLWNTFAACWPIDRAAMQSKIAASDVDAFVRRVHKLKGALRILQDEELAARLGEIERVALADGLAAAIPLWVQVESMLTHASASRDTRCARPSTGSRE